MEDRPRVNYLSSAELDPVQRNAVGSSALKRIGGALVAAIVIGVAGFILLGR